VSVCERKENTEMISVAVEIREGALTHRTRVTAPSIERALKSARGGEPGRKVRLIYPIEPEVFFVSEVPRRKEAA
jgi:hypothetical protein